MFTRVCVCIVYIAQHTNEHCMDGGRNKKETQYELLTTYENTSTCCYTRYGYYIQLHAVFITILSDVFIDINLYYDQHVIVVVL